MKVKTPHVTTENNNNIALVKIIGERTYWIHYYIVLITTVPLKWADRSLKSLKLSLLRAVLRVNGLEFVTLQPQRYAYVSR